MAGETVDIWKDVQGLLRYSYKELPYGRYLLLKVRDAPLAKSWLRGLISLTTHSRSHYSKHAINVAFTSGGLSKLGASDSALLSFSDNFREGMVTAQRSRAMGDVGPNDPQCWEWGSQAETVPDVLVMLFAIDDATAETTATSLLQSADGAVSVLKEIEATLALERDHFNFADGLSQPSFAAKVRAKSQGNPAYVRNLSQPRIAGMAKNDTDVHAHGIALGEFLLGHLNEAGQMAPVPSLGLPGEAGGNLFGKNGTYLVYRQMEQDPKALWDFCISLNPDVPHRISSWMVGRWPNGTPLMESPDSEAEANDTSNFQYRDDPFGRKCPIGSHIRRANPRDGLRNLEDPPSSSEADESLRLTQHHRILRRGRMYGPLWRPDPGEAYTPTPRGLSFLALNADIQGQFEMVQETWVNSPKFLGLYDEVDPLVGMTDPAGCPMSIPRAGQARMRIPDIPRFVTVRGGAYFFMPSLSAIQLLCDA